MFRPLSTHGWQQVKGKKVTGDTAAGTLIFLGREPVSENVANVCAVWPVRRQTSELTPVPNYTAW